MGIPIGIAGNFEENTFLRPLAIGIPVGIDPPIGIARNFGKTHSTGHEP